MEVASLSDFPTHNPPFFFFFFFSDVTLVFTPDRFHFAYRAEASWRIMALRIMAPSGYLGKPTNFSHPQ